MKEVATIPPFLRVMVMLTPDLVERLDLMARKKTMTRSLVIRLACQELLEQEREGKEVA